MFYISRGSMENADRQFIEQFHASYIARTATLVASLVERAPVVAYRPGLRAGATGVAASAHVDRNGPSVAVAFFGSLAKNAAEWYRSILLSRWPRLWWRKCTGARGASCAGRLTAPLAVCSRPRRTFVGDSLAPATQH